MDAQKIERNLLKGLTRMPASSFRRIVRLARTRALAEGLTYQHAEDRIEPTGLILVPMVASAADLAAAGAVARAMTRIQSRMPALRRKIPAVRDLLPLNPGEEDWFADCWHRPRSAARSIVSRWDLNVERMGRGRRRILIYEGNGTAIGGLNYGYAAERVSAEVARAIGNASPRGAGAPVRPLGNTHASFTRLLRTHAAGIGRRLRTVVWLEDRTWDSGITEAGYIIEALKREGIRAMLADPRDLRVARGEVKCGDATVDIVYRNMELRDIVSLERGRRRLDALRLAFRRNQVLSNLAGDLDHKSGLAAVMLPEVQAHLSKAERRIVRACVPWTRLVRAARCDGPDGRTVDLPEYIRRHRTGLVMKPNRECGGDGVTIGHLTKPSTWERVLGRALRHDGDWVVQSLIRAVRIPVPLEVRGRVVVRRYYASWGVIPLPDMLGVLGRASDEAVVNVSRGGGVVAVMRPRGKG